MTHKPATALPESVKGYIGTVNDLIYYHDTSDVYRATLGTVPDCRTGYLQGRWECSLAHWNHYSHIRNGLSQVAYYPQRDNEQ